MTSKSNASQRDPSDVTSIYQLGGYPNKAPGENFFNVGQGAVALQANETNLSLWPWGGLATLPDNKTAVGVYNVNTPSGNESFYTTLVSITAQEPTDTTDGIGYNMPTQRLVKQHFYPNEILYGYFALTVAHPDDSYLYLWGKVSNGLKLARAPLASIADRTTYKYWSAASKAWADQPPAADDATANAIPFNHTTFAPLSPSSGNVFWSPHHRTYLAVIMDSSVAGTFWVAYSTTGAITGPWTETAQLYQTPQDPACKQDGLRDTWNYSGFPHPGLDPSGASLVVSWSACGPFVDMSRLVWK